MQPETLPDGWTEFRFDEMASMVSERVDPAEAEADVYVGLEHIEPETLRIKEYGVPSDVKGQKLRFRPGHIIFGKRRAYQRKLAVAEVEGICSAHAMVLEAKPEVVHPDFLPFWMQSDLFMDRAVQISVGGLSPTINWKTLRKQTFVLPPMDRQRELVKVFRGVEDVLRAAEAALTSASRLQSSLVDNIFSQFDSDGVRTLSLGEVAEVERGKFSHRPRNDPDFYGGEHPFVQTGDIKDSGGLVTEYSQTLNDRGLSVSRMFPSGTVLITIAANIGETGILSFDSCFPDSVVGIRPHSEMSPEFVELFLRSKKRYFNFIAPESAQKNINLKFLREVNVPVPSQILQRDVVRQVAAADEATRSVGNHLNTIAELKQRLLSNLLLPVNRLEVEA